MFDITDFILNGGYLEFDITKRVDLKPVYIDGNSYYEHISVGEIEYTAYDGSYENQLATFDQTEEGVRKALEMVEELLGLDQVGV